MAVADLFKERALIIRGVFILGALILVAKALQIQLLDSSIQNRARAMAIQRFTVYPSRGLIYDRNNKLLVYNNAMYDLMVTYRNIDPKMDTARFCTLLGITTKQFKENLTKDWASKRFSKSLPFVFLNKLSSEQFAAFVEHLHEFPGFTIQLRNARGYPHPIASHVLGYLSEVNQAQIDANKGKYFRGDYVGSSGIELAYEAELQGKKGARYVLRDNMGREVGSYKDGLFDTSAVSGFDLITGLDLELQKYGELLMKGKTGAIVAIEPTSGEILTYISAPTYDPNMLTVSRNRGDAYTGLLQDSLRPFFDRALMAKYPPGSIFKTLVGLTALKTGATSVNRWIGCSMGYYYGGRVYKCHSHPDARNMQQALQHSCNAYFFTLLRDILDQNGFNNPQRGLDTLDAYAYRCGLGKPLGVDLPNENAGNIPSSKYYDKIYPKRLGGWRSPTVMSIGIGQGEVQLTTVQMANLAALIANRGWYITPHLVKGFKNSNRKIDEKYRLKHLSGFDTSQMNSIVEGMRFAVTGGTAKIANVPGLDICGKTGTSQNPHGIDHSVFFAFAPMDNPKIAIAVYVEHGEWGNKYAAPIASLMIEKYLKGEISKERKRVEEKMLKANLTGRP